MQAAAISRLIKASRVCKDSVTVQCGDLARGKHDLIMSIVPQLPRQHCKAQDLRASIFICAHVKACWAVGPASKK